MGGGYKLTLKCTLLCVLLLSFLLISTTFISCAGGASGPKGSEAEGTALAIKLPDTSKTIYNKEDIVSFTVTVSSGSFTSTKSANKGETMLFSNLPVGNYSVKAYGKTSSGAVAAKCETSVTIVAGETTTTTLHLARLEHWTVTFMNADGSELSTQDISDGYKATKPANPAPVSGKSFSGWTTDAVPSDTSPLFDFNTAITGDITLRPVFGVITYTVKYVSPVGSFTASDFTAATASSYSLPSTTGVTGVTFDNWYSDSAFSSSVDVASVRDITTFTKKDDLHYEKTIYAKWTVRVQFKGENISTHAIETIMTGFDGIWYGAKVSNPGEPTVPSGATFGGWYTGTYNESTGKVTFGSEYDFNSAVTEDITLYAKWNFVMHNVTYVSAPRAVPTGTATEFREIEGIPTLPTISSPTAAGCSFVGWTQDENFTLDTTPITSIPANTTTDVTLYAIWKVGVYFMNDLGSTTSYVVYGGALTKPTDPTKTGVTFGGWYKGTVDGEGNVTLATEAYDFDDADKNKVTKSIDLYPKWLYTDFTGTAEEFLAAEFVPNNTAATKYNVTITSATASEIPNIGKAIGESSYSNYKGVYINLDLSGCGATSLGEHAFDASSGYAGYKINTYLVGLTLPSTLTTIDFEAFYRNRAITSITIPDSVTVIQGCAFEECVNLTSITLPSNLTQIQNGVFEGCSNLTSISIPEGVTSMWERVFEGCSKLTSITIPNGVDAINTAMFKGCTSLTTVSIPDSVTKIWSTAFENCTRLTSVSLPDSVTEIGKGAFLKCTSLVSINLPASLMTIKPNAFESCSSLTTVSVQGTDNWRGTEGAHLIKENGSLSATMLTFRSELLYERL